MRLFTIVMHKFIYGLTVLTIGLYTTSFAGYFLDGYIKVLDKVYIALARNKKAKVYIVGI